jgi:hypothetical protein
MTNAIGASGSKHAFAAILMPRRSAGRPPRNQFRFIIEEKWAHLPTHAFYSWATRIKTWSNAQLCNLLRSPMSLQEGTQAVKQPSRLSRSRQNDGRLHNHGHKTDQRTSKMEVQTNVRDFCAGIGVWISHHIQIAIQKEHRTMRENRGQAVLISAQGQNACIYHNCP